MKAGNLYSASDKSIFDAISQSQVTKDDITELLFDRATIASTKTKRDKIADYYSKLYHDFYDYQKLSEILGTSTQKEKVTSKKIEAKINLDNIETSVHEAISKIESTDEAKIKVNRAGNSLFIHANYRTTNFNKTEFRQVVDKEAIIEIHMDDSGFTTRHPSNPKLEEWYETIIETLKENNKDEEIEENKINLTFIPSSKERSKFFSRLINEIEGWVLLDVTDVYVFHPKPKSSDEEDEGVETGVHISKASLKGEQVLNSTEIKNLFSRGFYISKITWSATKTEPESDKYIFEAQVTDPENFSGFSYLAKGFHKRKGISEYNKSRSQISSTEERSFYKRLEACARRICEDIIGDSENEEEHDGD